MSGLFTQGPINHVEGRYDWRGEAQAHEEIYGPIGPGFARVGPKEGAIRVLGEAREVEKRHHEKDMRALVGSTGGVLAVGLAELGRVGRSPPQDEDQVVRDQRVLVEAHDREEGVEDLVRGLGPPFPLRALADCTV